MMIRIFVSIVGEKIGYKQKFLYKENDHLAEGKTNKNGNIDIMLIISLIFIFIWGWRIIEFFDVSINFNNLFESINSFVGYTESLNGTISSISILYLLLILSTDIKLIGALNGMVKGQDNNSNASILMVIIGTELEVIIINYVKYKISDILSIEYEISNYVNYLSANVKDYILGALKIKNASLNSSIQSIIFIGCVYNFRKR